MASCAILFIEYNSRCSYFLCLYIIKFNDNYDLKFVISNRYVLLLMFLTLRCTHTRVIIQNL